MGQRGKIRTLARYIDFNSVILRSKRKALCFPNLVSLLPKSKIKRANPLAVCQFINCIHRRLRLTERGRMFFKTNMFGKDRVQQIQGHIFDRGGNFIEAIFFSGSFCCVTRVTHLASKTQLSIVSHRKV